MNFDAGLDQERDLCIAKNEAIDQFVERTETALKYIGSCQRWWFTAKSNTLETLQTVEKIQRGQARPTSEKELNDGLLLLLAILNQFRTKVILHGAAYPMLLLLMPYNQISEVLNKTSMGGEVRSPDYIQYLLTYGVSICSLP